MAVKKESKNMKELIIMPVANGFVVKPTAGTDRFTGMSDHFVFNKIEKAADHLVKFYKEEKSS